jgi:outer membrane protein assembly factor BamD
MFLALCLVITGCSWFGGDDDDLVADSGEQQMYREAQRHLKNDNFALAVRTLQMLESRYPFGRYAEQAQLELIYAHYGAYEFAAATEAADRFIRLHPRHPKRRLRVLYERLGRL